MGDFDERVLCVVKRIPRGKVATYRDVALALDTKAFRAVGQALKRNRQLIEIPCHRVVCSDGRVGGYAGQRDSRKKIQLLRGEGVVIERGRVGQGHFWKP